MILKARKFLIFLVIAAIVNVTGYIYKYYLGLDTTDTLEPNIQTIPSRYQIYKLKSKTVFRFSDLVCYTNATEDVHKEATTVHGTQGKAFKMCPLVAPDLGPVQKDPSILSLRSIDDFSVRVSPGGVYVPDCIAQQQVAIVLAVNEDMWKNVGGFILYIHVFLMKQQLEYQIFVVYKNTSGVHFDRGKLFNIGFVEAKTYRSGGWDCFIFHEVNLLPLDTRNLYRCGQRPKRLAADFRKPHRFGGAVAISPQHFERVDGFSNHVWSNDGDYINMYRSRYQIYKLKSKTVFRFSDLVCYTNATEDVHKEATTVHGTQGKAFKMCPLVAPDLGPVQKDPSILSLRSIDDFSVRVSPGGVYVPDCIAQQQVAIVLAVNEDMWKNVGGFILYIHVFLMKQQLEYQIFVVYKNTSGVHFDRGKLFNIGFVEAKTYRSGGWDCFIFHEVNLLPLDTRNLYRCGQRPKRLAADFRKPHRFGGAVAISPQHFERVDGFSNHVWSNDGDYINMYRRLMAASLSIESNSNQIGTYATIDIASNWTTKPFTDSYRRSKHKGITRSNGIPLQRLILDQSDAPANLKDGLSTLLYTSEALEITQFYSLIQVPYDNNGIQN